MAAQERLSFSKQHSKTKVGFSYQNFLSFVIFTILYICGGFLAKTYARSFWINLE